MKTQMKVLLYLKRNEQDANNRCPLMGRITIKNNRNSTVCFSVKLKVPCELWNATSQRCTGKSKVAIKTNREIESMLLLLHTRFDELCKTNEVVNANDVKNAFQGSAQSQTMFLQLFREYNNEYSQRVGVNRVANSFYKYQNTYRLVKEFINQRCQVTDVTLKSLNMVFMEMFDAFLRVNKRQQPNTRRGHITRLKSVIKTKDQNPFKGYKCEQPIQKQCYLSQDDLNRLMTSSLTTETRSLVRDMFLFSVFTGICYCDLQNLTKEHLKLDNEGDLWIETVRQKTGTPENVLLLDIAKDIINKHNGYERLFPKITYRSMMKQLKKVAVECGISRNLTFHMARHTFATVVCLDNGVPIETISKMLGHTSIKTTQIYAEIGNQKIAQDFNKLAQTANQKYKLQNQQRL